MNQSAPPVSRADCAGLLRALAIEQVLALSPPYSQRAAAIALALGPTLRPAPQGAEGPVDAAMAAAHGEGLALLVEVRQRRAAGELPPPVPPASVANPRERPPTSDAEILDYLDEVESFRRVRPIYNGVPDDRLANLSQLTRRDLPNTSACPACGQPGVDHIVALVCARCTEPIQELRPGDTVDPTIKVICPYAACAFEGEPALDAPCLGAVPSCLTDVAPAVAASAPAGAPAADCAAALVEVHGGSVEDEARPQPAPVSAVAPVLEAAPVLFRLQQVMSGALAILIAFIQAGRLFRQAGFDSMVAYAQAVLGMRKNVLKKHLRAGNAAWDYFPTLSRAIVQLVEAEGYARTPLALPEVPDVTTLAHVRAAVDVTPADERDRLLVDIQSRKLNSAGLVDLVREAKTPKPESSTPGAEGLATEPAHASQGVELTGGDGAATPSDGTGTPAATPTPIDGVGGAPETSNSTVATTTSVSVDCTTPDEPPSHVALARGLRKVVRDYLVDRVYQRGRGSDLDALDENGLLQLCEACADLAAQDFYASVLPIFRRKVGAKQNLPSRTEVVCACETLGQPPPGYGKPVDEVPLKKVYRTLVKQYHPDGNAPQQEHYERAVAAYQVVRAYNDAIGSKDPPPDDGAGARAGGRAAGARRRSRKSNAAKSKGVGSAGASGAKAARNADTIVAADDQPSDPTRPPDAAADVDEFGRTIDDDFVQEQVRTGAWKPLVVAPSVSGIPRPMTVFTAERSTNLVKFDWHGDASTFCPPHWADIAIGSGACGFGCRICFLMLTFRVMRDPLRPVVYVNGDDYHREVLRWLRAERWKVGENWRKRTHKDAIGLGIDSADSLLWEGVTRHARRLVPLFTHPETNPQGNPLILLTKSANVHYLAELSDQDLRRVNGAVPNVIVTMSVNPEPIADLWEGKFPDTLERITPSITSRLEAMRMAQDMGFEVRARIDPILTPPGWRDMYRAFFNEMAHEHGLRPSMLTLGTYREKTPQLDTFRAKWGLPPVEFDAEVGSEREGTHFHAADRASTYLTMKEIIASAFMGTGHYVEPSLCKETHEVRKSVDMLSARCNCLPEGGLARTPLGRRHLPLLFEGGPV